MAPNTGESYPGQHLSISQLLDATKKKLQDAMFGGRYAWDPIVHPVTSESQILLRTATTLIQPKVSR